MKIKNEDDWKYQPKEIFYKLAGKNPEIDMFDLIDIIENVKSQSKDDSHEIKHFETLIKHFKADDQSIEDLYRDVES